MFPSQGASIVQDDLPRHRLLHDAFQALVAGHQRVIGKKFESVSKGNGFGRPARGRYHNAGRKQKCIQSHTDAS
ncbi:MAG: hypothetical protein R3F31_06985 [Verrucomicrobiales bacterium]